MKLIIEIPENIYKFVCQLSCEDSYHYDDVVLTSVKNGTPIHNVTNGDIVMAFFPNEHDFETDFDTAWWNAPYQKGGKNE